MTSFIDGEVAYNNDIEDGLYEKQAVFHDGFDRRSSLAGVHCGLYVLVRFNTIMNFFEFLHVS